MNEQYINDLAKRVFEQNVARGWWDDMDRDIHQTLMLVVTEIAEATEGVRRDRMDDHLPHRKQEEVELADTVIRLLDLAGRYNWLFAPEFVQDYPDIVSWYYEAGADMPASAKHFAIVECVVDLARCIRGDLGLAMVSTHYSAIVCWIETIACLAKYDLRGAIEEKLAYNQNRADHSRENRGMDGGKKF